VAREYLDGYSLEFAVDDDATPASRESGIAAEGEATLPDGVVVHVLLHIERGRLRMLECYRDDGGEVDRLPSAREIRFPGWPPGWLSS
jgi:hypothetical protein